MTGLEYMRTVCPTTSVGKDPNREDIVDAFEDGIAEGWKQCKEKQWKPSDEQMQALSNAGNSFRPFEEGHKVLWSLYNDLKKLREGKL